MDDKTRVTIVHTLENQIIKPIRRRIHLRPRKDKVFANKRAYTKYYFRIHIFRCEPCDVTLQYSSKANHMNSQVHKLKKHIRPHKTMM